MQSLQQTPFLTEEARQSKRRHRNGHGSLTTIVIGRGQRCEVLNAPWTLPWRKGHAAATHLGLCNRLWAPYIFATSRQPAFLHLPTLNTVLTPIGNPPATLINSQEYQITLLRSVPIIKRPQVTPTILLHGLHRLRPPSFPSRSGSSINRSQFRRLVDVKNSPTPDRCRRTPFL